MKLYRAWGLIIIFGLLTTVVTTLPMVKFGPGAAFYTIDPDVQYLSNSFSYIEKGQIQYDVHPGTPTIILHSWAMLPLRVYAKLVAKMPFITWVLFNAEVPYYYVRIFQSLWLGLGMGIFLWSIFRLTRSIAAILLAWPAMFVYTIFPYLGSTIVPETTSFFLTAIWLLVFATIGKSISIASYLGLSVISGLALANKFSNIILIPITLMLVWFIPKLKTEKKILNSLLSLMVVVATFIAATWPIRRTYLNLWRWVSVLASTTGVHGGGEKAFFDLSAYLASVNSLAHREWWSMLVVGVTLVILLTLAIISKMKLASPVGFLTLFALTAIVVFAKFPLSHYQLINYALLVFVASALSVHLPKLIVIGLSVLLLLAVATNLANYHESTSRAMINTIKLERYVQQHPAAKGTLWEWARAKDFSFLWSRDWAHGVFDKELGLYRPNLLAITADMEKVKVNNRELKDVFDVCWDKFYVQTVSAPAFLAKYPQQLLKYSPLPEINDISLIESSHCYVL